MASSARRLATGSIPATLFSLVALYSLHMNAGGARHLIMVVISIALLLTAVVLIGSERITVAYAQRLGSFGHGVIAKMTISVGALLGVLVTFSSVSAGSIGAMALVLLYPRIPAGRIVGSDIAHAVPLTLIAGLGHWCNGVCPSCCAFVAAGWIIARHPHRQLDFRTCSRIWSSLRPGGSADYRWKQIGARCFRWMKSRHWTSIE
jgi:hypothetical protein